MKNRNVLSLFFILFVAFTWSHVDLDSNINQLEDISSEFDDDISMIFDDTVDMIKVAEKAEVAENADLMDNVESVVKKSFVKQSSKQPTKEDAHSRRLLSGGCTNGICNKNCDQGTTGAVSRTCPTNTYLIPNPSNTQFDNSYDVNDVTTNPNAATSFLNKCCQTLTELCGNPTLSATRETSQRQMFVSTDAFPGPHTLYTLSFTNTANKDGTLSYGYQSGTQSIVQGSSTAIRVPPHGQAFGGVSFQVTYDVKDGGNNDRTCTKSYTDSDTSNALGTATWKPSSKARYAVQSVFNNQYYRMQQNLIDEPSTPAIAKYMGATPATSCTVDACRISDGANILKSFCTNREYSTQGTTASTFDTTWRRGFEMSHATTDQLKQFTSGQAFDSDGVSEDPRSCNAEYGNWKLANDITTSDPNTPKLAAAMCRSAVKDGSTYGRSYRGTLPDKDNRDLVDRAPTIWHKPGIAEKSSDGSGTQYAPIDFVLTDETMRGTCGSAQDNSDDTDAAHSGSHWSDSDLGNPDQIQFHVCVRTSDQTSLPEHDRYDNIHEYFEKGDLAFEFYDPSTGLTNPAVSKPMVTTGNTPHIYNFTNTNTNDQEHCFVVHLATDSAKMKKNQATVDTSDSQFGCEIPRDYNNNVNINYDNLLKINKPINAAEPTQGTTHRVYGCSVRESSGTGLNDIQIGLDANTTYFSSNTDVPSQCQYSSDIKQGVSVAGITSQSALRLKAKAGFQRQIAIRLTSYADFDKLNVDSAHAGNYFPSAESIHALGDITGGIEINRRYMRTTMSMLTFSSYAQGVISTRTPDTSGIVLTATSALSAKHTKTDQTHVGTNLEFYGTPESVAVSNYAESVDTFIQTELVDKGYVSRVKSSTDSTKSVLSDTVRFDLYIEEKTGLCTSQSKSSIEDYFFGRNPACLSADTSEGKTGRVRFLTTYEGTDYILVANEYECGKTAKFHLGRENMAAINSARTEDWGKVIKTLIENLKVQRSTDYSTQMCNTLKYDVHVGIHDERSCGSHLIDLQGPSTNFLTMDMFTTVPTSPSKFKQVQMDLRKGASNSVDSTADPNVARITFKPSTDPKAVAVLCASSKPFSIACSDLTSTQCRVSNSDARTDRGTHTFTDDVAPRDLDYVASLEVTDMTNLVSYHQYKKDSEGDDYYSQLDALLADGSGDNGFAVANVNAAIVMRHSFKIDSDTVTKMEEAAATKTQSFAYKMLHAKRSDSSANDASNGFIFNVPAPSEGVGSNKRTVTRYSIFGSIDAFAIAGGNKNDVMQKCVPCASLFTGAENTYINTIGGAVDVLGMCKRSREAMGITEDCKDSNGQDIADFSKKVVKYNQEASILGKLFPMFSPVPGWRDPIRVSISLLNYEWIDASTLGKKLQNPPTSSSVDATSLSNRITERGTDLFTVLPQCNEMSTLATTDCTLAWTNEPSTTTHTIDENGNTGNKLGITISPAPGHYDGVCTQDLKDGNSGYDEYKNGNSAIFEQTTVPVGQMKFCLVGESPTSCGQDYTCTPRAFKFDSSTKIASPANKEDARVSSLRLLTGLESAYAAEQESVGSATDKGNKCARAQIKTCTADDDKDISQCRQGSEYTGLVGGYDEEDTYQKRYFSVTDQSDGTSWWMSTDLQRGSDKAFKHCGNNNEKTQANQLTSWTAQRVTDKATYFPPSLASMAMSTNIGSGVGVYESLLCNSFTPSTVVTEVPTFGLHAGDYTHADPKLTFSQNFHSKKQTRNSVCTTTSDSIIQLGAQVQQVAETQPRSEYGGGHIFVSTCKILPADSTGVGTRDITVTPKFDEHNLGSLTVESRTDTSTDSNYHNEQWNGTKVSTSSTTYMDTSTGSVYLFEADHLNWNNFQKATTTGRSDSMAGGISTSFPVTNSLYGDVRPTKVEMIISFLNSASQSKNVGNLLEVDTVLYTNGAWQVRTWTYDPASTKFTYSNDAAATEATDFDYQPTPADLTYLSSSECGYLYTHSKHTPGLAPTSTFDQKKECRRIVIRPKIKNLDFRKLKIDTTVYAQDSVQAEKSKEASITVPVVNVAGQPGLCYHNNLLVSHSHIANVYEHGHVSSDTTCLNTFSSTSSSDGNKMDDAHSRLLPVEDEDLFNSVMPLPIGAISSTFMEKGKISSSSGEYDPALLTPADEKTWFDIPCKWDTTCNFYKERSYINICAEKNIQLYQKVYNATAESYVHTLRRFKPLDASSQQSLICGWADSTTPVYDAADRASIADLTATSETTGTMDRGTHAAWTYADSSGDTSHHDVKKGGRLYRLKIASSKVTCTDPTTHTGCKVGFTYDSATQNGDGHMNALFYAAGHKDADANAPKVGNRFSTKIFLTSFTEDNNNNGAVSSIDVDGHRTRSQKIQWNSKTSNADLSKKICHDSVTSAGNYEISVDHYDTNNKFTAYKYEEIKDKTIDQIKTTEVLSAAATDAATVHSKAKVVLMSSKDLSNSYIDINVKSQSHLGTGTINFGISKIMETTDGNGAISTWTPSISTVLNNVTCTDSTSTDLGLCNDVADSNDKKEIKLSSNNHGESIRFNFKNMNAKSYVMCFTSEEPQGNGVSGNLDDECKEFCILAMSPDMNSQAPTCSGTSLKDNFDGTLIDAQCSVTATAAEMKHVAFMKLIAPASTKSAKINIPQFTGVGHLDSSGGTTGGIESHGERGLLRWTYEGAIQATTFRGSADLVNNAANTETLQDDLLGFGASNSPIQFFDGQLYGVAGKGGGVLQMLTDAYEIPSSVATTVYQDILASSKSTFTIATKKLSRTLDYSNYPANSGSNTFYGSVNGPAGACMAIGVSQHEVALYGKSLYYGTSCPSSTMTIASILPTGASSSYWKYAFFLQTLVSTQGYASHTGTNPLCLWANQAATGGESCVNWNLREIQAGSGPAITSYAIHLGGLSANISDTSLYNAISQSTTPVPMGNTHTATYHEGTHVFDLMDSLLSTDSTTGKCVRNENGVKLTTHTTQSISVEDVFVEYTGSKRKLKEHLPPHLGGNLFDITTSGKVHTIKMKSNIADYVCQLELHQKLVWFQVAGDFATSAYHTSNGKSRINLGFIPKDYVGLLKLDKKVNSIDIRTMDNTASNKLKFDLERTSTTEGAKIDRMLAKNHFQTYSPGTKQTSSTSSAWVQVKACVSGLVHDRRALKLDGVKMWQNTTDEIIPRLTSEQSSRDLCARKWVNLPANIDSKEFSLSLDVEDGRSGCALSSLDASVSLSLCESGKTGCLILPHAPSAGTLPLIQAASSYSAHECTVVSGSDGSDVVSCTATDAQSGAIDCAPQGTTQCGLTYTVTDSSSPVVQIKPGTGLTPFTIVTTSQQSGGATSKTDSFKVMVTQAGDYTVVSEHSDVCLTTATDDNNNDESLLESSTKADIQCTLSKTLFDDITDQGTTCKRWLKFKTTGAADVTIGVRGKVDLKSSATSHIYVGKACVSAAACPIPQGEGAYRISLLQLPSVEPTTSASHIAATMSRFGMGFSAPAWDSTTNQIKLDFEMGRYRPSAQTGDDCWVDSGLGVDDVNGIGHNTLLNNNIDCDAWGSLVPGRGYSPRLTMIGVGSGLGIDETSTNVFTDNHKRDGACSPMRNIGDSVNWGTTTLSEFKNKISEDAFTDRARCTEMPKNNALTTFKKASDSEFFSDSFKLAYAVDSLPSQPQWNFAMQRDSSANAQNSANRCGSRYMIKGQMQGSLNKLSQCHHVDANGAWSKAATHETTKQGEVEVTKTTIPVTMNSYTSTKPRGSGADSMLQSDAVTVMLQVFTKTTSNYRSTDVTLGNVVDLPTLYTEKVDLMPETPNDNSIATYTNGKQYHMQCYDDCTGYCASDDVCVDSCQVVKDLYGNIVPNSFGKVQVTVKVETVIDDTSDGYPFVYNVQSFQEIDRDGVGSRYLKSAEMGSVNKETKLLSDVTHSTVKLMSSVRRLLKAPGTTTDVNGYLKQQSNEVLETQDHAFNQHDAQCDSSQWTHTVPDNFAHAKGDFPEAIDFAFQMQIGKCHNAPSTTTGDTFNANACVNPVVGEMKTARLYLDYTNAQTFVNPKEISTATRAIVFQGDRLADSSGNVASYTDLTTAQSDAANTMVTGDQKRLASGQPFSLMVEIEGGEAILGNTMALQQKYAATAIKHEECTPHTIDTLGTPKCPEGSQYGKCGKKLDQSDKDEARHVLSNVVLAHSTSTEQTPTKANLQAKLDTNTWYKKLRDTANSAIGVTLTSEYKLCYGNYNGGVTVRSKSTSAGLYCPHDDVASVWDGADKVNYFLTQIRDHSCDQSKSIFLCNDQWCYFHMDIQKHDVQYPDVKSCIVGANPTADSNDRFVTAFKIMEVVRDFAYQELNVRQNNYYTMADMNDRDCMTLSTVDNGDKLQARGRWEKAKCSNMNRLVTTNFAMKIRQDYTPANDNFPHPIETSVQDAARHIQCSAASKSTLFPSTSEEGRVVATRNWLRNDMTFGSAFGIPCVEREAFLTSVITDTRNQLGTFKCARTKVTCESGKLKVEGLSQMKSLNANSVGPGKKSLYYRNDETACNAAGESPRTCHPQETTNMVLAQVEGFEIEACGGSSHVARYKEANGKGLRFVTGAMQWIEDGKTDSVKSTEGKGRFLYTLKSGVDSPDSGYTELTCGSTTDHLKCDGLDGTAEVGIGDVSTGMKGRRLLTVRTSDGKRRSIRRSSDDNDITVNVNIGIGAGGYASDTCANTQVTSAATCSVGYIKKQNHDSLVCNQNSNPGESGCTHSYCCTLASSVYITNNYLDTVCTKLDQKSTQMRMAFIGSMSIGIILLLLLLIRYLSDMIKDKHCLLGSDDNFESKKPSLVLASEAMSGIFFAISSIIAMLGQDDGEWIDECGLNNDVMWAIWVPLFLSISMIYIVVRYYRARKNCPPTEKTENGTVVALSII